MTLDVGPRWPIMPSIAGQIDQGYRSLLAREPADQRGRSLITGFEGVSRRVCLIGHTRTAKSLSGAIQTMA